MTVVPRIIGHRGVAGLAPENTIAGFHAAKEAGVTWVEFDVKLSRDGIPILFHDDRLDRTTTANGPVALRSWGELKGLDAGSWFAKDFEGENIPKLLDAIRCSSSLGIGANIEIKPCPGREVETGEIVAAEINRFWPVSLPTPIISSFSMKTLEAVQVGNHGLVLAPLFKELPNDWEGITKGLGAQSVHCGVKNLNMDVARSVGPV